MSSRKTHREPAAARPPPYLVAAAAAAVVIPVLGVRRLPDAARRRQVGAARQTPVPTNSADADADFLTGDLPAPGLIDGLWRVDNGTLLMLFNSNGTMRFDNSGAAVLQPGRDRYL